ncbi:DUF6622 family protein [Rhizobium sp. PAMB 3174]
MQMPIDILTHTPSWVWLVLALLVFRGLKRTKTREVSQNSLILLPAILTLLALRRLVMAGFDADVLAGTATGIILAFVILLSIKPARQTRRLPNGKLLLQGEWLSLGLLLVIFAVNYVDGVLTAIDPAAAASQPMQITWSFVNGLSVTLMVGRSIMHLLAGNNSPATSS